MPTLRPIRADSPPSAVDLAALTGAFDGGDPVLPGGSEPVAVPVGVAIGVRTSGSTGAPRTVLLSRGCLAASAEATVARLGGPGQWLLALAITHIAGIQVVVRAHLAGAVPVVVAPGGADFADGFTQAAAGMDGSRRYTSLVPTQLRRLLDAEAYDALQGFDAILLGGAAADPRLLAEAASRRIRVVTTYGMSETSGGCVYDGVPLDGVEVQIDAPAGDVGPIVIRGDVVAVGYLGESPFAGVFATSDAGRLSGGVLEVVGRTDDLINSGGEKVAPARVEAALLEVDGVTEAAVVGVADREWGEAVVAAYAGPADEATVRAAVSASLRPAERPRRYVRVDAVPRLGIGKVDHAAVLRLLS